MDGYQQIIKIIFAALGGLLAYIQPTISFLFICLLAILLDCFTAWMLDRRVKRRFAKTPATKAYFTSRKMSKIFHTMLEIFGIVVLSFLIDNYIFMFADLYLANIVSGVFCMCQVWSVLENISSEREATWAKLLQKVMVSKVSRHLDIDIAEKDLQQAAKPKKPKQKRNE